MLCWNKFTSLHRVYSHTILDTTKRLFSSAREEKITTLLKQGLTTDQVQVLDVSGGCGAMFKIEVRSKQFKGKNLVEQHKMVNELLSDEIKNMHGLTLRTVAVD